MNSGEAIPKFGLLSTSDDAGVVAMSSELKVEPILDGRNILTANLDEITCNGAFGKTAKTERSVADCKR